MAEVVALVDYGAGNLHSVANALKVVGAEGLAVTADPSVVRAADRIVLPGVGSFRACAEGLRAIAGMEEALTERVQVGGAPFLGICVGMQLLATSGVEHGTTVGLGWIPGEVRAIERTDPRIKVPHMGWNDVQTLPHATGLIEPGEAYFLHSYHFAPEDGHHVAAMTDHGGGLVAAVARDTVLGVQFHPEKSQAYGLELLARFLEWRPVIVFPAIDLKGGQVVRLAEGDMDRATVYGDDPAAQALAFAEAGSQYLHVVDLDGSFAGKAENRAAVEAIVAAFPGHVQLGGGIRDAAAVAGWFNLGVSRVVMGTAALKDPEFVRDMAREWPGGIVVAVDAKDGMVATEGWAEVSDVPAVDLARRFEDAGVASLLFTDIGRDGLLKGCNIDATVDLARRVEIPVIASGGVKGLDDVRMLALHAGEGIEGVITGRALYDGRLDLAAAIAMAGRA